MNSCKSVKLPKEYQFIVNDVYYKHKPERYWAESWDFNSPYIIAGDLISPLSDNIMLLTTDHLLGVFTTLQNI